MYLVSETLVRILSHCVLVNETLVRILSQCVLANETLANILNHCVLVDSFVYSASLKESREGGVNLINLLTYHKFDGICCLSSKLRWRWRYHSETRLADFVPPLVEGK